MLGIKAYVVEGRGGGAHNFLENQNETTLRAHEKCLKSVSEGVTKHTQVDFR